ncbi:MAG: hypothetical protein A2X57_10370 [Nitrospirae bacterium GWD2_57_8]|nr:MAG: hypothetical protein A2X57_10370 [Nitrospirae bacterium GWD2_57_8]
MKIRTILLVFSLLSVLTVSLGGYRYYLSLKSIAVAEAHKDVDRRTRKISDMIAGSLAEFSRSVRLLAGLKEIPQALIRGDAKALVEAERVLGHVKESLEADVCYLMNRSGIVVASSNRNEADSFIGHDYSFRPYFRAAMQGSSEWYSAMGVTSKKLGLYISHPVYDRNGATILGAVVIKTGLDPVQRAVSRPAFGVVVFTDESGIVLASSREDWSMHSFREIPQAVMESLVSSRRYGSDPPAWTGVKTWGDRQAMDADGLRYEVHSAEVEGAPGWKVVYLHDHRQIMRYVSAPLFRSVGTMVLALTVFTGLGVFLLYKKASYSLADKKRMDLEREKMIAELQQALSDVRKLSGMLPICMSCKKIRDDKGYWNQIEEYISEHTETEFSHGLCPECAQKLYPGYRRDDKQEKK